MQVHPVALFCPWACCTSERHQAGSLQELVAPSGHPSCAAACSLPLWHSRIAPRAVQLERALPTEEARHSSLNAGTFLRAISLGFFGGGLLRWLTVSS